MYISYGNLKERIIRMRPRILGYGYSNRFLFSAKVMYFTGTCQCNAYQKTRVGS